MSSRKINRRGIFLLCLFALLNVEPQLAVAQKTPALLELQYVKRNYQGKVIAMDNSVCWLQGQDGQLFRLPLHNVKKYRQLAATFKPLSATEIRAELMKKFGGTLEVAATRHYMVCAEKGHAQQYAELFEEVYRAFHLYFSTRGFRIQAPEQHLVAIVFPDHQAFKTYCQGDGFQAFPGLMGYYHRISNRVALFDTKHEVITNAKRNLQSSTGSNLPNTNPLSAKPINGEAWASIRGSVQSTMIHEATHQVAFNTGLHTRIGNNPKWIVEGLATVFEAEGIRNPVSHGQPSSRVNQSRLTWFHEYKTKRRQRNFLSTFLTTDKTFQTAPLDAYAEAWALSFFLIETRPTKYAAYLKLIKAHDPMKPYPSRKRLEDFQTAFGKDLAWLEVEYLRFIDQLQ